jgi:acetyl-CoA decarbonylase/synthase complex subunit delta
MPIEIPKDKWTGSINTLIIGGTSAEGGTRTSSVTIGGQTTMPFMQFEAPTLNKP